MRYWNGIGWTAHRMPAATVNNVVGPPTVSVASGPNHTLHLIWMIFTCGLWLPVWLTVILLDRRMARVGPEPGFRGFMSAHSVLTGIGVLASLVLIVADWKAFLLLASLAAVVVGLTMLAMLAIRSVQRRRQEKAEIAARADDQHEAVLRGDDQWGVFGIRLPAQPTAESPATPGKSGRTSVVAGGAVVVGVLVFALMTTVYARSTDRTRGPVSASRVRVTTPASRPIAQPMIPLPPVAMPFPFIPAPVPAPTSTPTQPAAPPVRMGQQAVDGNLTFVVTSFDRSETVGNPINPYLHVTAKGIFVDAHVTISNTGTQPEVFFAADQKFVVRGIVFNVDAAAAMWTLTTAVGVSAGASVPVALSFDVPTDTPREGMLELHESSMSRGVDVALLPPN